MDHYLSNLEVVMTERKEVEQKKDHFWWVHPMYRGKQAMDLSHSGLPKGSYKWLKFFDSDEPTPETEPGIPEGEGDFKDLAKTLFKLNNYRPGPVDGWYIVICLDPGKAWAVGQMRADSICPVQVFEDLVYDNEGDARRQAENLKKNQGDEVVPASQGLAGPLIKKMAEDAKQREDEWKKHLSTVEGLKTEGPGNQEQGL
ncbi:hypothetical protein imdm_2155 [gamma proteobacterium IMCC2047]|nr:hypothetical protein imdm_2155 [gamma proteobacterium IMCC2047]